MVCLLGHICCTRSDRTIDHYDKYSPDCDSHSMGSVPTPEATMQSVTEAPITIYRHHTTPLFPTDDITPLGSGNIFTDIIVVSSPQARPRGIKCVKHPLNDRDAGFLSVNWGDSAWRICDVSWSKFRNAGRRIGRSSRLITRDSDGGRRWRGNIVLRSSRWQLSIRARWRAESRG